MSNVNKGGTKLASALQAQMQKVVRARTGIFVERGEIVKGGKLKLYSIPDFILDKDDYSVCATVYDARPLKAGDRVLVVHTSDGEPVVIDRIIEADSI